MHEILYTRTNYGVTLESLWRKLPPLDGNLLVCMVYASETERCILQLQVCAYDRCVRMCACVTDVNTYL